jgi:hypothetical protein
MISRKAFGTLTFALVLLSAPTAFSQQAQPSIGEQAKDVVLDNYRIDPENVVPKTGKPLSTDGTWAISKKVPDSCPKTKAYPCVQVVYRVQEAKVSCEWTVLLLGSESIILDMNEDAALYLAPITSDGPPNHHAIARPKPVFPLTAKMHHVFGTVKMLAQVSTTGSVEKVTVISGPAELRGAAADAAKQWTYPPLVLDSATLPFQTIITFHFRMSPTQ